MILMVRPGSLGLVLKPESIELTIQSGENQPLDKANSIIRLANQRISELKQSLAEKGAQISHLKKENNRQRAAVENDIAAFSDFSDRAIMGVSEEESFETIKKNYKRLSLIYHPDKGGNPHMMKLINAPFERLKQDDSV
jgi:preprotein translocase subunit Sec63